MLYCRVCGVTVATPYSPRDGGANTLLQPNEGWFRTPFQVLLFAYLTLGCYSIYWLIRSRRLAEMRTASPLTSYWWALLLAVPFVNLFVIGDMTQKISFRVRVSTRMPALALGLQCLLYVVVSALWRLPGFVWLLCCFASIFIATMHASIAQAERNDNPTYVWPRFTVWEWVLLCVGVLNLGLAMVATLYEYFSITTLVFVGAVFLAIVVSLVLFGSYSQRFKPVASVAAIS